MRVVDLRDIRPGITHQLQLAAQDRNASAHKFIAGRIGFFRFFGMPHPLAQERRRRQRGFDLLAADRLEKRDFPRDEARFFSSSLSVTIVKGRPSGNAPTSKPCASSAITPMQDFRHHSPSVITSSPAHSCSATAERIAASLDRR